MSRLIVKGLPSYLTDARLRDHFAQKGTVTDVKLMKRPDGTSRRFGFVGYRSEADAEEARKYFDRTYIDTSRINVSVAKQVGDEELQAKKAARNKSPTDSAKPKEAKTEKKSKPESKSASFEEFMSVMAPKLKRKSWMNNEDLAEGATVPTEALVQDTKPKKKRKGEKDASIPDVKPSDGAACDEGLTDLEYMRRRMRHTVAGEDQPQVFEQSDSEAESEEGEEESDDDEDVRQESERRRAAQEEKQRKDEEDVDTIMESGRLFVRNLPFSATEDEVASFFASFGEVEQTIPCAYRTNEQAHIPVDAQTKASKGLAFVKFADPSHALLAFRGRDGAIFQGRLLHVLPAVNLTPRPVASSTLKQKRWDAKKAMAGKDFQWGMLYMSSDAVASSVSDRFDVPKATLLGTDDDSGVSPAVRLALAETRVIQETKQFFADHGMHLDKLEHVKTRTDDTILVKNIPYGTGADEIRALFARYGDVARVLIPPSNTIAVVEMPVVNEARAAFRALAYKRFKDSVIYLEKAPTGFLPPLSTNAPQAQTISGVQGKQAPETSRSMLESTSDASAAAADGTLYVKNLSFATTSERLADAFRALDGFVFARVQTKPDPKHLNSRLSMGYGFVGFMSAEHAQTAQRAMNAHVLDGHTLSVSFTRRGHDADDGPIARAPSAKMLVKNVPFEATRKDIRELFGAHGQLKSVRLPKQVHGRTRGFAFVEFVSRREAENAMAALLHTHLLGRHLVLEWAGDAEGTAGVDELREKTRNAYVGADDKHRALGQRAKIRMGSEQVAQAAQQARSLDDDDDD